MINDRTKPLPVMTVTPGPMPGVDRKILSNGVELVTLDSRDVEDVTRLTLSWNHGSYDSAMPPAAEMATQLSRTGSRHHTPDEIADLFDYNGAWLTSELSGHNNTLSLHSLNRTLEPLLEAVVDMTNEPIFPEKEFVTTREKIAAMRATQLERVQTHADMLDLKQCFGEKHPVARQYTPRQIREIYIDSVIGESRMLRGRQAPVAYLVGRLTPGVLMSAEKLLAMIDCDPADKGMIEIIDAHTVAGNARMHHEMKNALQSAVRISIPTIPRSHPDYELLRLTVTALGGYFGSRLMTNIREEKGLTYGISAGVYGYREGAFISISSQCDNRYVDRVIEETIKEIERLSTQPMEPGELNAVKQVATSSLLTTLDTPFSIMDYHMLQRHIMTPADYYQRQQRAIKILTPQLIKDTAAKYLVDRPLIISTAGQFVK